MPKTTGKARYLTKGIKFSSNYMRSYKHKKRSRKRPSSADDHKTTKAAFIVKPESRYAGWLDPWASDSNAGQSRKLALHETRSLQARGQRHAGPPIASIRMIEITVIADEAHRPWFRRGRHLGSSRPRLELYLVLPMLFAT